MSTKPVVSLEALAIDVKRDFAGALLAGVKKLRDSYESNKQTSKEDRENIENIINLGTGGGKKEAGMRVRLNIWETHAPDAAIATMRWDGHQGTRPAVDGVYTTTVMSKDGLEYLVDVDVKALTVTGKLCDEYVFDIYCSLGFVDRTYGFTDEEVTAILTHEVGHGFDVFITMGDYIALNYFLQDGIDVLLGTKQNKQQLKILDATWMAKNIPDPKAREAWANSRTPDTARRAILSAFKDIPRYHLYQNEQTAWRREEQMADLFTSRLGLGRPLATGLHKMHKICGYDINKSSSWLANFFKIILMTGFLPFTIAIIAGQMEASAWDMADRYDDPQERLLKIRRDLVNQLKNIKDTKLKPGIDQDLKVIDEMLKEYDQNRTLFEELVHFFKPSIRRQTQYTQYEHDLEELFHNDLFVQAYRIKQLA